MLEAAVRTSPTRTNRIEEADQVLQRLIDSLQVLVLVLNGAGSGMSDPRHLEVTGAASRALDDALNFRRHFRGPTRHERP